MRTDTTRRPTIAICAASAAAVLFALHLATYFVPSVRDATLSQSASLAIGLAVLAVAQHLVVLPVVAALPAPAWARRAGYLWVVVDMGTDLAQLAGAPKPEYLTARLAINLVAALWIAVAAWHGRGTFRGIGLFVAVDFALYSFLGPFSPKAFVVALPSLVLLPVWFVLAGRRLARMATNATAAAAAAVRVSLSVGSSSNAR
jgi:hypothetical protein